MLSLNKNKYKDKAEEFKNEIINNLLAPKISEDEIEKLKNEFNIPDRDLDIFKQEIIGENLSKLEELIVMIPQEIESKISYFKEHFEEFHNKNSKIYKLLKEIFIKTYNDNLNKKWFYELLGIKTCIYCNRNYIFNLDDNGHVKGHIDHFYPKAKYPYLALSFYNLIPSCETCNKIKGEYDTYEENVLNPYEREENMIFNFEPIEVSKFEVKINDKLLKEKLLLENIYNKGHSDIIEELYVKFCQENTKEHFKSLRKSLKDLSFSDDEIYRFLTCGYKKSEDFHKRSFSKMINDFVREYDKTIIGIK